MIGTGKMRTPLTSGRPLVAGVAVALAAVWLIPQLRVDENRAPVEWPAPSVDSIDDASFFADVNAVFSDRLPLKGTVVHRTADLLVTAGLSPRPTVIRGDGGLPFYSVDFTAPCGPGTGASGTMPTIQALAERLDSEGTQFVYAIVPDRSMVLREKLGANADALLRCADVVRGGWSAVEDPTVLVAWDEFRSAHARGENLYLGGDTHWNYHGAALFSDLLLDRLAQLGTAPSGLDLPSDLRGAGTIEQPGDLFLQMGVDRLEATDLLVVERRGVTTRHEAIPGGDRWVSTSSDPSAPLIPGRTLVLTDSMFGYDDELLAPYFADLTAVSSGGFAQSEISLDYDLVIIQQVQRSVPQFLGAVVDKAGLPALG